MNFSKKLYNSGWYCFVLGKWSWQPVKIPANPFLWFFVKYRRNFTFWQGHLSVSRITEISSACVSKIWIVPIKQWIKLKITALCWFMHECVIVLSLVEPLKAGYNFFSLETYKEVRCKWGKLASLLPVGLWHGHYQLLQISFFGCTDVQCFLEGFLMN